MKIYLLEYNKYKNILNEISKSLTTDEERLAFSKYVCYKIICRFWDFTTDDESYNINEYTNIKNFHFESRFNLNGLIESLAKLLSNLDISTAGYYIGNIYTTLLPTKLRSEIGAYYTPPVLVDRLLSTIDNYDLDWSKSRIIDPACGGAAFLGALCEYIFKKLSHSHTKQQIVQIINNNISGYEIDSFAAWISQTLLELSTFPYIVKSKLRIKKLVHVGDSLNISESLYNNYDLVIGNPPYGKVKLNENIKSKYNRSLYGHANLYGLFIDLSLRLLKDNGYIAFVIPTSFLGGHYFKKLRQLLVSSAPLKNIDFIKDRTGVFSDVLQETVLATFCKNNEKFITSRVNEICTSNSIDNIEITEIGEFKTKYDTDKPWLLPRSLKQLQTFYNAVNMNLYLSDYGYEINTGQLVWNRHKNQLRTRFRKEYLPLIWAESILPNGEFHYQAKRKNHEPYIKVLPDQNFLITNEEAILVQRTTSKEQNKRIIAAVLNKDFLDTYKNGVVIENHINIIKKKKDSILSIKCLNYLLNSNEVDNIFRCISGSVAVSAYELNSIPMPPFDKILELEKLINDNKSERKINEFISKIYGAVLYDTKRYTNCRTNL